MTTVSEFNEIFATSKPIIGMIHLKPLPGSPVYDGNLRERFGEKGRIVLQENKDKYEKIAEFPLITKLKPLEQSNGKIKLEYNLIAHSVRFIELIPVK